MAGKPRKGSVAAAAAAAATAAVKAAQADNVVKFAWASDVDDEEGEELREEIISGLEQIHEDAGDVAWELYADTPADKAGQIRKLATSELRRVRDECLSYGPGEYHVIARGPDGTFVKKSRYNIRISHFARPTTPAPNTPTMDPMALIQQMEDRAEKRRLAAEQKRDAQIRFWAPLIAPIGVKLAEGLFGRSSGESVKDLVGALVGMKELVGGGSNSDRTIDTLLKGIELARDMAPDNAKGSSWPDVLLNGLKEFRPLAENLANRGKTPTPAAPAAVEFRTAAAPVALPAGNGASPPPSSNTTAAAEDPMWRIIEPLLQKLSAELEEYAANGTDPGLAAEALLAKVPRVLSSQIQPQQMKEWLTQPNWWDVTLKFRATLAPYQGFCDDVRLNLLQVFENELNPTKDPDDAEPA